MGACAIAAIGLIVQLHGIASWAFSWWRIHFTGAPGQFDIQIYEDWLSHVSTGTLFMDHREMEEHQLSGMHTDGQGPEIELGCNDS